MTKMIRLDPPADRDYYGGSPSSLSDYDVEELQKAGVDVCVYYYTDGGYDGSGAALIRKDGQWAYVNLGHCSCNGPIDEYSLPDTYQDLNTLVGRMSGELLSEVQSLVHTARELTS